MGRNRNRNRSRKRKEAPDVAADHEDGASSDRYVKRRRTELDGDGGDDGKGGYDGLQQVRPKMDPRTGQRAAFPGLEEDGGGGGDSLCYGDPEDGIEYLRMVRSVFFPLCPPTPPFSGECCTVKPPAKMSNTHGVVAGSGDGALGGRLLRVEHHGAADRFGKGKLILV